MKCLLVEPGYRAEYPNIALMKFSTKLKSEGKSVEYFKGKKPRTLDGDYDEIYITTLFTYEAEETIDTINHYRRNFPSADIQVGGIMASLMPEYIERETGIKPFQGYSKELDSLKPDYDLIKTGTKWDDFSFVFTSRGCVNNCPYCAVPKIETENWINPNWKNQVDFRRLHISIQDNNLTAQPIEHFKDVMHFCRKFGLITTIESGLDCRLFNEEHLDALRGVRFDRCGLRFAFDHMAQEGYIQKTLEACADAGIGKARVLVYVLYNFNDTPQEAEYRMREVIKFKFRPYPQQYTPLDKITRNPQFIGKYWTPELASSFRNFYHIPKWFHTRTFPEWLKINKKDELLEQFYEYSFVRPSL